MISAIISSTAVKIQRSVDHLQGVEKVPDTSCQRHVTLSLSEGSITLGLSRLRPVHFAQGKQAQPEVRLNRRFRARWTSSSTASYWTAEPTATIRLETCSEVPAEILNRMTVGRFDGRTRNRCTSVVLVHPLEPSRGKRSGENGRVPDLHRDQMNRHSQLSPLMDHPDGADTKPTTESDSRYDCGGGRHLLKHIGLQRDPPETKNCSPPQNGFRVPLFRWSADHRRPSDVQSEGGPDADSADLDHSIDLTTLTGIFRSGIRYGRRALSSHPSG